MDPDPGDSFPGNLNGGLAPGGASEGAECLGMRPGCFRQAKAFIRGAMDRDEQLDYLLHVQQCPDCRGYLEAASMLLLRRDRIREQLAKGGGNRPCGKPSWSLTNPTAGTAAGTPGDESW